MFAKDGRKPKLCDAALKELVIDRMCSSGWGGAAGWGLTPAAGRNQKEEKRKPLLSDTVNAGRSKLEREEKEGFRAHLHSYLQSTLSNPSISF